MTVENRSSLVETIDLENDSRLETSPAPRRRHDQDATRGAKRRDPSHRHDQPRRLFQTARADVGTILDSSTARDPRRRADVSQEPERPRHCPRIRTRAAADKIPVTDPILDPESEHSFATAWDLHEANSEGTTTARLLSRGSADRGGAR